MTFSTRHTELVTVRDVTLVTDDPRQWYDVTVAGEYGNTEFTVLAHWPEGPPEVGQVFELRLIPKMAIVDA